MRVRLPLPSRVARPSLLHNACWKRRRSLQLARLLVWRIAVIGLRERVARLLDPPMANEPAAAPICTCSDVDDSDGSASAEDNPDCPIHGWDDADEDPTRLTQFEEDMYLYGI